MEPRGELVHEKVSLSLRCPRVALVFRASSNWRETVRHILCSITPLWGSEGIVLVPHNEEGEIQSDIWRVLQEFDPDHVVTPQYLYSDFLKLFPSVMTFVDQDEAPLSEEQLHSIADEFDQSGQTIHDPLSLHVAEVLAERLPVFRHLITAEEPMGVASQVFLDLNTTNVDWPQELFSSEKRIMVSQSQWESDLSLAAGAAFGMIAPNSLHTVFREEPSQSDLLAMMIGNPGKDSVLVPSTSGPTAWAWNARSPALVRLHHGYSRFRGPIVVGDSVDDFSLYHLCRRVYGFALWLTPQLLKYLEGQPLTKYALWNHLSSIGRSGGKLSCTSVSLTTEETEAAAAGIQRNPLADVLVDVNGSPRPLQRDFSLNAGPLDRCEISTDLYVEDCFNAEHVVPTRLLESGQIVVEYPLVTPLPPDILDVSRAEWIVDVEISRPIPPGAGISPQLFTAPTRDHLRDVPRRSRAGVSWQAQTTGFVMAGTLPQNRLVKPVVRVPSLLDWAEARVAAENLQLQFSSAGRIANLVANRAGSRRRLRDLATGPARPILEAYRPVGRNDTSSKHFPEGDGVVLAGEPFLKWSAMKKLLLDDGALADTIDEFSKSGLIRRGFVLNCQECPHVSFVPVAEVGINFRCPRCGATNYFESDRWRRASDGPPWFYDLHASMRSLWEQNGDLCLRTSARLSAGAQTYLDLAEFELIPKGKHRPEVEIDLLALADHEIIVVEAKSNALLDTKSSSRKRTAEKKLLAAKRLRADKLILSTNLLQWNEEDLRVLHTLRDADPELKDLRIEVMTNV